MSQSTNNKQRFSTLRLFKNQKPPPLPPKDSTLQPHNTAATLHSNRSFLSIQTDPQLLSPYSLHSAAASTSSMSVNTAPPKSASSSTSKKPSMFFKFGRKNKTAPQPKEDVKDDESISLPWNFEHTIHVNETLVGLPPSWSNRLSEAGFSEEEIVAIQEARRAAGSVSLYRLNTMSTTRVDSPATTYGGERSVSPVSMSSRGTRPASPAASSVAHPSPRSTSLRRVPPPPLPINNHTHTITPSTSSLSSAPSSYSHRGQRQRQESVDSHHTTTSSSAHSGSGFNDSSMNVNLDDFSFPIPMSDTPNFSTLTQVPILPQPQRRFIVTNASSPPPAYASGGFFPTPSDEKNRNLYTPTTPREQDFSQHASSSMLPPPPVQDGEASPSYEAVMQEHQSYSTHDDEADTTPKTTTKTKRRSKRFSAAPPRLSLSLGTTPSGDDGDDWTRTLLSSIPSAAGGSGFGLGLGSTKEEEEEDKRKTIISPLSLRRQEEDGEDKRKTIIAPLQMSSSKFASSSSSGLLGATMSSQIESKSVPSTPFPSNPPPLGQRSASGPSAAPPTPPRPQPPTSTPPSKLSTSTPPSKSRSIPSIILPTPAKTSDIPMWDDIMDTLDANSNQSDGGHGDRRRYTDISYLSAALSESQSPTLPLSPTPSSTDSHTTTPTLTAYAGSPTTFATFTTSPSPTLASYATAPTPPAKSPPTSPSKKQDFLSAGESPSKNTNRDSVESRLSTQSIASTSTVTAHTIVNVERGVRAMASVVPSPMKPLVTPAAPSAFTPPKQVAQPEKSRMVPSETTTSKKASPEATGSKTVQLETAASKTAPPIAVVKKVEPITPAKASEKDRTQVPQWKLELAERARHNSTVNSTKDKKKPADLLLPPPASSFGYSAVASNLVSARAASLAAHKSSTSYTYHPQMFQGAGTPQQHQRQVSNPTQRQLDKKKMESPQSSHFGSEESGSSSSSTRQSQPTPITENDDDDREEKDKHLSGQMLTIPNGQGLGSEPGTPGASILNYYTGAGEESHHDKEAVRADDEEEEDEEYSEDIEEEEVEIIRLPAKSTPTPPPPKSAKPSSGKSVLKYQPWLADLLAPIRSYIDDTVDCRDYYMDLQEMAEGESGSVFSARVLDPSGTLKLPPFVRAREAVAYSLSLPSSSDSLQNMNPAATGAVQIAIKSVRLDPSGTPKLLDVQNELELLHQDGWNEHILNLDALYVDLVDDALWIRMELMERSIADVLAMVEHGLMLQERMIARFASDAAIALEFLESKGLAHRDVRSDNLLINRDGTVKLADFSNAIRTSSKTTALTEPVGVAFWQPPEMRRGRYNASKVDVWSLGATVWEMAESEPPFSDGAPAGDRWPPISQPTLFSPAFHDFLKMCSEPEASRPSASKLVKASFIQNACGRPVIVHLLSQCMTIEAGLQETE